MLTTPAPPPKDASEQSDTTEQKATSAKCEQKATTAASAAGRNAPKGGGATPVGVPERRPNSTERWLFYTVKETPTLSALDVVTSVLRNGVGESIVWHAKYTRVVRVCERIC